MKVINSIKGRALFDGKSALAFARMRYDDPNGDFGRQERQRLVIEGILAKGLSLQIY